MGKTCCGPDEAGANNNDPTWRRILWIALGLNAIMFGVEIVAGNQDILMNSKEEFLQGAVPNTRTERGFGR